MTLDERRPEPTSGYLTVSYNASAYFDVDIDDPAHPDRQIEVIVARFSCGSGIGFGRRDVEFEDVSPAEAAELAERLTTELPPALGLAVHYKND